MMIRGKGLFFGCFFTALAAFLGAGSPVSGQTGGTVPSIDRIDCSPMTPQVPAGQQISFIVIVTNGTPPFSYQWQQNGINLTDDTRIHGASEANLRLSRVLASDAGTYTVIVTNIFGTASTQAVLVVTTPPTITTQPLSQALSAGMPGSLSVGVSGTGPFTYQWRHNGTNLPMNLVTTVAGGYFADQGPATNAILASPTGLAIDGRGNLYTIDAANNRIRKVDTNGIISTVAGNGIYSSPNETGVATNSSIAPQRGIAVDAVGNVYFAGLYQIRKVDANGVISTVAGNGLTYNGASEEGIQATNSRVTFPTEVAVDNTGNLFFYESMPSRIRKVNASGIISTVVSGNYDELATDKLGNLYIRDWMNRCIRKRDANGTLTVVAGNGTQGYSGDGGAAISAQLDAYDLTVDSAGNLYIADGSNNRIRKVDTNGIITTVAGNGAPAYSGDGGFATNAGLICYEGIAIDTNGNLFLADSGNNRLRRVDTNGIITTVAGTGAIGDGQDARLGTLFRPHNVAVDAEGNLFVADTGNNRVRKISTNGIITTVVGNGQYVFSADSGPATEAAVRGPTQTCIDSVGNLYVGTDSRVFKIGTNGIITAVAGNGMYLASGSGGQATNASLNCSGVAVDRAGVLYIADNYNYCVWKVKTNGIITRAAGNGMSGYSGDGGSATSARTTPNGIGIDSIGNLFISELAHVRKVATNGIITTVAGGGAYYTGDGVQATSAGISPCSGVAFDTTGNFYFVDFANYIRKVDTQGIITTVAGSGKSSYSGEYVQATNTGLFSYGLTTDKADNLLIADYGNNRIRKVALKGSPSWVFPSATESDQGTYSVIISNSLGCVTSSVTTLTVTVDAPAITTDCADQITTAGSSPTLSVSASGSFLSYQWFLNAVAITNATAPSLTLYNVTTNQSGLYSVVVSNVISTATSRSAHLLVVLAATPEQAPRLLPSSSQDGKLNLHFSTLPGYRYLLQYSDSLTSPNWTTLQTTPAAFTGSEIEVVNDVTNSARFYRVIISN